jgi:hypothetical protein
MRLTPLVGVTRIRLFRNENFRHRFREDRQSVAETCAAYVRKSYRQDRKGVCVWSESNSPQAVHSAIHFYEKNRKCYVTRILRNTSASNRLTRSSALFLVGTIRLVLRCSQGAQRTSGLTCDQLIVVHRRQHFTLYVYNIRSLTYAWVFSLHFSGQTQPDTYVFRRMEQHLRETWITPAALEIAGRPRMVRTPANEDVRIAAVGEEPWRRSGDLARELGLQPRVL